MPIRPQSIAFTVLLGALAALPPLSIDMGLPAFPALEQGLHASAAGAGLTLSVFMAGFSVAQLGLGPLSDRYGRRPVLLAGLLLYAGTGVLCAAAPSIGVLIGFRLIQGACAASGTVMAFAITRDLFDGVAARQRFSYVSMVLSVAPVIAPTLGSLALRIGGWRAIYGFLGFAGAALLVTVAAALAETRRPRVGLGVLGGYARMLRHRRALGYALTNAMGFGALFAYISGSPLVLMGVFGLSAQVYGLAFAVISAGIMAGAWTNSRLARSAAASHTALGLALAGSLLSAFALLALTGRGGIASLATLLPLLLIHTFCRGISSPNATHGALEPMGEIAGLASAVVGFLQMATAAVSSALVALLFPLLGPAAMALVMTGFSLAALVAWRMAQQPAVPAAVSVLE